jgi:hypothetical protein
MSNRKIYYPQRNFDDTFAAFVDMCTLHTWEFPGIQLTSLQDAVKQQRSERAAYEALALQYRKVRMAFAQSQAERHALFCAALHAARGSFRNNHPVRAQLDRFRAVAQGRRRTPQNGDPPDPVPLEPTLIPPAPVAPMPHLPVG